MLCNYYLTHRILNHDEQRHLRMYQFLLVIYEYRAEQIR